MSCVRFQVGDRVEAVDPEFNSMYHVSEIIEIRGDRAKLKYSMNRRELSNLWQNLHHLEQPGWCKRIGIPLKSNLTYEFPQKNLINNKSNILFRSVEVVDIPEPGLIRKGVVVATLNEDYFVVGIDGVLKTKKDGSPMEKENNESRYAKLDSPYILKSGFCKEHGLQLHETKSSKPTGVPLQLPPSVIIYCYLKHVQCVQRLLTIFLFVNNRMKFLTNS